MKLETLFEKFELFVDAPHAVTKLRDLVLELAVTGRLVSQNRHEGTASTLLEAVRAARARFVAEGKIKARPSEPVGSDERPYDVPPTWEWARLSDVGHEIGQKVPDVRFTYLDVGSIDAAPGRVSARVESLDPKEAPSRARKLVTRGTVIYSTVRPYLLNIAIVDRDFDPEPVASTAFGILHPFNGIDSRYLFYWLRSAPFTKYVQVGMKGMAYPAISDEKFYSGLIALPPTAEQRRIVAKVDELMALFDRLEVQQQEREARRTTLGQASLARFADVPTPANLNFLFHDSYAVEPADLRKSIVAMAMRGRLVEQDQSEEPGERLLARIRESLGRGSPKTKSGETAGSGRPFDVPRGWTWARFPDLGQFGRGKSKHRPRNDRSLFVGGTHRLVQTGDVARANGTILTHTGLYNDVGLAQSKMWPAGTLCITIAANIADSGVLGFNACFPDSVVGFVPAEPLPSVRYFEYFIRTAKERLEQFAPATAQRNINLGILEQLWIPIPPAAEQGRIVARVDQLMSLIDQLERQLASSQATGESLGAAIVAELTQRPRRGGHTGVESRPR